MYRIALYLIYEINRSIGNTWGNKIGIIIFIGIKFLLASVTNWAYDLSGIAFIVMKLQGSQILNFDLSEHINFWFLLFVSLGTLLINNTNIGT